MKFFVAKVDPKKVRFDAKGQAMLSPLRFHYDSEHFACRCGSADQLGGHAGPDRAHPRARTSATRSRTTRT
jgi:hypothetical protein